MISRYFLELRSALRLSPQAAAFHLQTTPETIEALECGRVDALPRWPEVVRIVMTYATMAGIDGRPALAMISETISAIANSPSAAQPPVITDLIETRRTSKSPAPARRNSVGARFGKRFAAGAMLLPQHALRGVRARPDRALYALSLPLGALILAVYATSMNGALTFVSDYFRANFGETREGLRWIEVSNPRARRGDKLQVGKSRPDKLQPDKLQVVIR